jgi:taurine dioxygenase
MSIKILPLAGSVGAEIKGVDVSTINDQQFKHINKALLNYGVIYFREQDLTPGQQLDFARRWNEPHLHPYLSGLPEHPEIIEIIKEPNDPNNFGDHWHTDQIFTPAPAMATMLYAKEVPEIGGDTLFACMAHAYDALSDGMKKMVGQLSTFNQYNKGASRSGKMQRKIPDPDKPTTPAVHPLVRKHPETGYPALYLTDIQTTLHFENMTPEESRPIIMYLLRHATRPEFTCRVDWQIGTLGIWDNRRLMHMALNDYPGKRRVMHRITIKGTPPLAFNA